MSRSRRDNMDARRSRGPAAFEKHFERQEKESKCNLCGRPCRASKLEGGLCPLCRK